MIMDEFFGRVGVSVRPDVVVATRDLRGWAQDNADGV